VGHHLHVARDQFSGISPAFWYFWIGLLLVVVGDVRSKTASSGGWRKSRALTKENAVSASFPPGAGQALRITGRGAGPLARAAAGVRYALIGPKRRGQDHAHQT